MLNNELKVDVAFNTPILYKPTIHDADLNLTLLTGMPGGTLNIRAYPNKWTKIWRTILLAHFRNIAKSTWLQE
jgi:hypothetical protein